MNCAVLRWTAVEFHWRSCVSCCTCHAWRNGKQLSLGCPGVNKQLLSGGLNLSVARQVSIFSLALRCKDSLSICLYGIYIDVTCSFYTPTNGSNHWCVCMTVVWDMCHTAWRMPHDTNQYIHKQVHTSREKLTAVDGEGQSTLPLQWPKHDANRSPVNKKGEELVLHYGQQNQDPEVGKVET